MGDSRAYLFCASRLTRLTEDHSVVALLLKTGEISAEEARTHPARNTVSRYVGMPMVVNPDVRIAYLESGSRLLLCTDGLTRMLDDRAIAVLLETHPNERQAVRALVDAANGAGGEDNVTAVVVHYAGHSIRG